jgi:hypothetical protein
MRRLLLFYCVVFILFLPRAAYEGLLAYASSVLESDCGDLCDPCQRVPVIIYQWLSFKQEIAAIVSALSSALLSVVSARFIITDEERRVMLFGDLDPTRESVEIHVMMQLQRELGLNQLL